MSILGLPSGTGASLVALMVKNLPAVWEIWVQSLGQEHPLGKGIATDSSILAWRIPWTEEPDKLQFMGSERVRQDWAANTHTHTHTHTWISCFIYLSFLFLIYKMQSLDQLSSKFPFRFYNTIIAQKDREDERGEGKKGGERRNGAWCERVRFCICYIRQIFLL